VDAAIDSMRALNRGACEIVLRHPVHACTDITGFGLLGHAREMAKASGVCLAIDHSALEFLPGAIGYSAQGALPGGLKNNRTFVCSDVQMAAAIPPEVENLLYDPQTSGGLFVSVAPEAVEALAADLSGAGIPARTVGQVRPRGDVPLMVY
jgi:selenide,water dikinase